MRKIDIATLNDDQKRAWELIINWLSDKKDKRFVLSGKAGSGKSYLLSKLREYLMEESDKTFCFMTFTGKAAEVLRERGIDEADTIHSTIYKPVYENNVLVDWRRVHANELPDLIIIDEFSMLNREMIDDIESFNKKILYVGDEFQLPPIGEDENYLVDYINFRLTYIVRQAEGNPIIEFANKVRDGQQINYGTYKDNNGGLFALINSYNPHIEQLIKSYDQVLCGPNKTRRNLNQRIRKLKGYKGVLPNPSEKIICLKNNRNTFTFNGQMKLVKSFNETKKVNDHRYNNFELIESDGSLSRLNISEELFYDSNYNIQDKIYGSRKITDTINYFDLAHAISVHKSQGSQFDTVVVYANDGKWMGEKFNRWLYSAITRAVKKCVVVI